MAGAAFHPGEQGPEPTLDTALQGRNPLLCLICDDYYSEPCLLNCFHTFCARCLRGTDVDGKITCPLCGQQTRQKEGSSLPPPDTLMRQLMELANAENPPCANCDKRDKTAMCFCSTCRQALCSHCRENTHRAKMFSTHEVVHMSQCAKETHRKCVLHGEQYIMFSNSQKIMLCVNCFRDTPTEARLHCVDIDTAYTQCSRKLEKAIASVHELQNSVREGLLMFQTLLEELAQNMETEKHTINSFCQGMQEAIAKTHSSMIMEVQRQFETKERQFRGQLVSLSTVLPLLQLHLLLCSSLTASANKYQFLDLAHPMMDRLASVSQLSHPLRPVQSSQIRTNYRSEFSHSLEPWVGKPLPVHPQQPQQNIADLAASASGGTFDGVQLQQMGPAQVHPPVSRRQHSALCAKALEGEGPFSNHCRSFDSQLKELNQQLNSVKERLGDLHRDVTLLRRAHTPPLIARCDHITRECTVLEEQLERHQVELERLKNVFDTLWEEQLCRIHVEQDIFQSQMNNILTLRSEVKHLSAIAHQLEPYVKSLSSSDRMMAQVSGDHSAQVTEPGAQETSHQQLQSLLEHIAVLQMDAAATMDVAQKGECRIHPTQTITSPTENMLYVKDSKEPPVREGPRIRASREALPAMADVSGNIVYTSRQQAPPQQQPAAPPTHSVETVRETKRGVLSQLIEKVRTKEDRKKSPVQDEARLVLPRERSKSDGRANPDVGRSKVLSSQHSDDSKQSASLTGSKSGTFRPGKIDGSGTRFTGSSREGSSKVASFYHSISGKVLGSKDLNKSETSSSGINVGAQASTGSHSHHHIPPPPPPTSARRPQPHPASFAATAELITSVACADVRERLESHLKEKLQHMMTRTTLVGRVVRPPTTSAEKGDDRAMDLSEYQRISEAMSSPVAEGLGGAIPKQSVRVMVHHESKSATAASTPTSPRKHREKLGKFVRLYPASDTEDSVFRNERSAEPEKPRKQNNSIDSLTFSSISGNSRRCSVDLGDRKTLVLVIGPGNKGGKARVLQKQRSWETFPPKKRSAFEVLQGGFGMSFQSTSKDGKENANKSSGTGGLKKADSFEGHEEAVRTLVAAVQETRTQQLQQQRKQSHSKPGPT